MESETYRPYIVFERTRNKGRSEKLDKKTGAVIQPGEHVQEWRCELSDENGELFAFATSAGINYYINKGYRPKEMGGFEGWYQRHDASHERYQDLRLLEFQAQERITGDQQIAARDAKIAELEAKLDEPKKKRKQSAKRPGQERSDSVDEEAGAGASDQEGETSFRSGDRQDLSEDSRASG